MIKSNDLIIAGLGIGVSLVALYLWKNKKQAPQSAIAPLQIEPNAKKTQADEPKAMTKEAPEPVRTVQATKKPKPWLIKGSEGKEVERLQIWLLRNHGWKGPVTGIYDEQTDSLVKKRFRQDHLDKATYEKYQMGTPIHELIKA